MLSLHNIGTVFEPTGYAKANREIVLGLARIGVNIRSTSLYNEEVRVPLEPPIEAYLHQLNHTPLPPDYPVMIHYPAYRFAKFTTRYSIGMTMYECSRLPFTWVRRCSMMDEIWVPSSFNQQTFAQSGIPAHRIQLIPYGVDSQLFQPRSVSLPIPGKRAYTFLSVCSFDERKGIHALLAAFCAEFAETEDVCLIIKTRASSPSEIEAQQALVDQIATQVSGGPRSSIILISNLGGWSELELAYLYNSANCYVLPTRGEGWSMTVMEAMASSLPVITTSWSAHMDYLDANNSYLIRVQAFAPYTNSNKYLYWAIPDLLHLRQLMRHAYLHPDEAQAVGRAARQTVVDRYTWDHSAARIADRLHQLTLR